MTIPPFDKAKPFRALVLNYAIYQIGFLEAVARIKIRAIWGAAGPVLNRYNVEGPAFVVDVQPCHPVDPHALGYPDAGSFATMIERVLGHPVPGPWLLAGDALTVWNKNPLRSRFEPSGIEMDMEWVIASLWDGFDERTVAERTAAALSSYGASMLNVAYEMTYTHSDKGPTWEFLRHCRNAAAHGGRLSFQHNEPRRKAEWRGIEIVPAMQGMPLVGGPSRGGLFYGADPILLLWDLECAYPSIGANP